MSRTYQQIILSRETDVFSLDNENAEGTVTVTQGTTVSGEQIYVTDIAGQSGGAAKLSILDGTAFRFQLQIPANTLFEKVFASPIKISVGTTCEAKVEGANGIADVYIGGYVVKT